MIVVATADFEVYHDVVGELRNRGVTFMTIEPGDPLPERTSLVLTGAAGASTIEANGVPTIVVEPDEARQAVDQALATIRGDDGRTVIGVDPGRKPGIAVVVGDTVVAAFQVPLGDAIDIIERELENVETPDPVVRIGDGARLQSAKVINQLEDVRIELVDETGTSPYLGTGARGMSDVLAAVNIARLEGEPVDHRTIEPTAGELQRIKDRSREESETNRAIDDELARRVARGELTVKEALSVHRADTDGGDAPLE